MNLTNLLRDPLAHFLILGAMLFGAYSVLNSNSAEKESEIFISTAKVENLISIFSKTWQRNPSPSELANLVDEFVREEMMYRQGKQLGLDQDDTIIRRRLRQKMEFIVEDEALREDPQDSELLAFLEAKRSQYLNPAQLSFVHVYIDPSRHADFGKEQTKLVQTALDTLPSSGADWQELGDRTMLQQGFKEISARDVDRLFGEKFGQKLVEAPIARWSGPLQSGYGIHFVRIEKRVESALPQLSDVRQAVLRDYQNEKREEYLEKMYREMRAQYQVTLEKDIDQLLVVETARVSN